MTDDTLKMREEFLKVNMEEQGFSWDDFLYAMEHYTHGVRPRSLESILCCYNPRDTIDHGINWSVAFNSTDIAWSELYEHFDCEELKWPMTKMELVMEELNG